MRKPETRYSRLQSLAGETLKLTFIIFAGFVTALAVFSMLGASDQAVTLLRVAIPFMLRLTLLLTMLFAVLALFFAVTE